MPSLDRALGMYLQLARAAGLRGQGGVRDKLLILAGATAAEIDQAEVASECRDRILEHNPQHLIRRWPSFAEAMEDEEFLTYLRQQARRYSVERAEHLLSQLGIDPYSPAEYSIGEDDFSRLLEELDQDPREEELDVVGAHQLLSGGRIPRGGAARRYVPARRYNRAQPSSVIWLVVLLGIITCAIYIGLALSG